MMAYFVLSGFVATESERADVVTEVAGVKFW
jgi:hypothetical protein